jgi:hypothetical protein
LLPILIIGMKMVMQAGETILQLLLSTSTTIAGDGAGEALDGITGAGVSAGTTGAGVLDGTIGAGALDGITGAGALDGIIGAGALDGITGAGALDGTIGAGEASMVPDGHGMAAGAETMPEPTAEEVFMAEIRLPADQEGLE